MHKNMFTVAVSISFTVLIELFIGLLAFMARYTNIM